MKNTFYMVGNAHLDPMWQWRWQEGSAEAKATIRSALDRMKEHDDFIFVCSSCSVYEWIEEFDPDMFDEIKERVKEGRFVVVGGWYVQPDCNLPCGESFARHSLYCQRWFYEKFGVTAKIGYNVDSFGHNGMMPQILRESGLQGYVFMRPNTDECNWKTNLFNWISPDGTSIPTYRIPEAYSSNFTDAENFEKSLTKASNQVPDIDFAFRFYGVGNHGGGPTKRNIQLIKERRELHPETKLIFSNVIDLFDRLKEENIELPEWHGDLQHYAPGCYSAYSKIKNDIRRCECELVSAETFSYIAKLLVNREMPSEKIREAWKDVLFMHFHDVAGGCCIRDAYSDTDNISGESRMISSRLTNNALQTISWKIDTSNADKGIPVVVFNPNPWQNDSIIQINAQAYKVTDTDGVEIPFQSVRSQKHSCWRMEDTVFNVSVPAMGYKVYYMLADKPWTESLRKPLPEDLETKVSAHSVHVPNMYNVFFENICLENDYLRIEFDGHTGHICSFVEKENNREWFSAPGAVPAVMQDIADTWGHGQRDYHNLLGVFADAKITILESGPVRATVLVENRYDNSILKQYFSLSKTDKRVHVKCFVDWREKNKMLKMQFPVNLSECKAHYEIPFGHISKPCNGDEEPGQQWIALEGSDGKFALLNDNIYGFSVNKNIMEMTVLHSAVFCDHGGKRDDESEYTEQGIHRFAYDIMPVNDSEFSTVVKAARELNSPLVNIIENNHEGVLPENYQGISCDKDNIIISAIKRSENGEGVIIRAYETNGKCVDVVLSGDMLRVKLNTTFTPYSVKTFFLKDGTDKWEEVLFTEFKK